MRFLRRTLSFALSLLAGAVIFLGMAPQLHAQGGEPQYFAIKNATVVPVSGPRVENATVIVSRGVISAIGKDAAIPEEAWVIDGTGLTVYPGLIDAFTDVGLTSLPPAPSGHTGDDDNARAQRPLSRGPEDRPGATPWRVVRRASVTISIYGTSAQSRWRMVMGSVPGYTPLHPKASMPCWIA